MYSPWGGLRCAQLLCLLWVPLTFPLCPLLSWAVSGLCKSRVFLNGRNIKLVLPLVCLTIKNVFPFKKGFFTGKPALKLHWRLKAFWLLRYSQHLRMLLLSIPPPAPRRGSMALCSIFSFGLDHCMLFLSSHLLSFPFLWHRSKRIKH